MGDVDSRLLSIAEKFVKDCDCTEQEFYNRYEQYENNDELQSLVIDLEYAIRRFFHVWYAIERNSEPHDYGEWTEIINGWSWKSAHKNFLNCNRFEFWTRTFRGIRYLIRRWFVIGNDLSVKREWIEAKLEDF